MTDHHPQPEDPQTTEEELTAPGIFLFGGLEQTYSDLLPAQYELFHVAKPEVTLDICVYQGGYGSGKTWAGSLLGLSLSKLHPGIRGMAVAKTWPLLRDTTLQTYFEHLQRLGFTEGREFVWRATEQKLVFPMWGYSEILFHHLQSPEKIKSLNLGWIHVEEMSQILEADFLMLLARLRQTRIPRHRLFGTTNPQPGKGWIYHYFGNHNNPLSSPKIQYRRIIAPTTQNVHLDPAYVENMKNQFDPDYYRINVLGQDGDYTTGLVCKTWTEANIQPTPYYPDQRIYLSCDFNVDPMCWVLAHRYNEEYHFFDELCLENTTTVQAAEEFFFRYMDHKGGITITGDASGRNRSSLTENALTTNYTLLQNELSRLGFRSVEKDTRRTNPSVHARVESWNALVCNGMGHRRVYVHPKCKWLIENCNNLRYVSGTSQIWEPTPNQIEANHKLKFVKHVWDAASYLVERFNPITLELPEDQKRKTRMVLRKFVPRPRY